MNNNENDKNKNPKKHFWIHDNEVEFVTYSPTSRNKPKDIDHYNHGIFLSKGMNNIEKTHLKSSHPLKDKLMIFKIELPEEDIVDKRGDYENLFLKNNLKVNSIKKSNVAVVSTTPAHFKSLSKKLNSYTSRKGASYNFFQNIKSISSFDSDEKLSTNLLEKY
ncbi:hypothetical protein ACE3MZ_12995 [Paenibacillus sp. WLX1005]|uniref:hypothetical protein n=1 Tax=Paenibacillus sp. WLX1005 TaxID=3243766 RepID=UPI0039840701